MFEFSLENERVFSIPLCVAERKALNTYQAAVWSVLKEALDNAALTWSTFFSSVVQRSRIVPVIWQTGGGSHHCDQLICQLFSRLN